MFIILILLLVHLTNTYEEVLAGKRNESDIKTNNLPLKKAVKQQHIQMRYPNIHLKPFVQRRELQLISGRRASGKPADEQESFYEPYHSDGEWVFLRTVEPTSTLSTIRYWGKTTTIPSMQIYRACDQVCLYLYKSFGEVCGQKMDTGYWIVSYRTFKNICELEYHNCRIQTKRPMWFPAYRGKCHKTSEGNTFPIYPREVMSRALYWKNVTFRYEEHEKQYLFG